MRILMTNYEFPPLGGGAGKMAHGLATRLAQRGDEVDFVTMGFDGLPQHESVDGVGVYRVPANRRQPRKCTVPESARYVLRALPLIRKIARERRYDLVHSHFVFPDGLLAMNVAGALGLPYVITAHGTDVPGHNPHRVRALHALLAPLWRRVTTSAAAIVCPSASLAEKVARANPRAVIEMIPNALASQRFHPKPQRQPRLLAVARMIELKGLQYLLQALHRLPGSREIVFAGDGPYAAELKRLAAALDVPVRFTGWLEHESQELTELYETSDIFVFPSEAENCPLVLLEAMAAGLSIITTTHPGCKALVGDAALLVPPCNPEALAAAIKRLDEDEALRRRLGEAARRRVVEHFNWDALVKEYMAIYHRHVR
jgi:glycosyltransferase involved in cell wall biosynthesis